MDRCHLTFGLAGVGLAAVLLLAMGVTAASLAVLVAALACPISMLIAMRLLMRPATAAPCHRPRLDAANPAEGSRP